MLSKEEVKDFISMYETIKEEAIETLKWYNQNVCKSSIVRDCDEIEFIGILSDEEGTVVCFRGDEYWSYGGYEEHYEELDIELLFSEKAREEAIKRRQIFLKETEERKREKELEKERKKEEEDKAEYQRLKEKYNDF
jgi:hypothetical protein